MITLMLLISRGAFAQVTTDGSELLDHFVYDKEFHTTAIDPDVIVLCPMEGKDSSLYNSGKAMQEEAEKLANTMGGRLECKTGAAVVPALLQADLTEYGTVLITTHGKKFTRGDGSTVMGLALFRDDSKDVAQALWDVIIDAGMVDLKRCVNCIEESVSVSSALLRDPAPYLLLREVSEPLGSYYEMILTSDWFMGKYADSVFPNTLFYFNTCESYGDAEFQGFLIDHGASRYLGNKNDVSIPVQLLTDGIHGFMKRWTEVDSAYENGYAWRYVTISEANKAILNSRYCDEVISDYDFTYRGMGHLRGKVTDGNSGKGLSDVRVHAWTYWDGKLEKYDTEMTKSDGSFVFPGLPWGMYLLQAENGSDEGFLNLSFADTDLENAVISITGDLPPGTQILLPDEPAHPAEGPDGADTGPSPSEDASGDTGAGSDLKGILYIDRPYYTEPDPYSQNDKIIYSGNVNIYTLDPETGESVLVRSFPIESAPVNIDLKDSPPFVFDGRGHGSYVSYGYDKNYEHMTLDIQGNDGSRHVGWMDEAGNVTDVTALTWGDRGDFAGLPNQFSGCFGPGNYFYWYEEGWIPYRVPLDNLTPGAVEQVEQYMRLYPDGTVFCQEKSGSQFGTYYTDASMREIMQDNGRYIRTWSQEMNAWLQNGNFIELYEDTIRRGTSDGSAIDIIPDIKDRWNINPVVSPDGSRIAFISSLRTLGKGVDHAGYVFTVPSGGGDPVKVSSDIKFVVRSKSYCYLLEWR